MQELTKNEIEQVNGGIFGAVFLVYIQIHGIVQNFK
ncbi:MAG: hypothetical protein ACI9LM_005429 [Alteromonadaceae bacterium]|jgi:hypothetical protein